MVHGQIVHLIESVAMIPELEPDHMEAAELARSDLGAVLDGQTFPDFEFVLSRNL